MRAGEETEEEASRVRLGIRRRLCVPGTPRRKGGMLRTFWNELVLGTFQRTFNILKTNAAFLSLLREIKCSATER